MNPFASDDKEKGKEQSSEKPVSGKDSTGTDKPDPFVLQAPKVSLPKGGGSIKSIDEKFKVNASNGTAGLTIPLPLSRARDNFGPDLSINYNSGSGNGIFGLGWQLSLSSISRKTDKGMPRYDDEDDSDTYLLAEAEDLVPLLRDNGISWETVESTVVESGITYLIKRYIPRIEGNFLKIERWKRVSDSNIHWRTISGNNVIIVFGKTPSACITDPLNPNKIFKWLPELSYDDRGNCIAYHYKTDNLINVPRVPSESHRLYNGAPFTNTYLASIQYGAKTPYSPSTGVLPAFMFETVFDYNEAAFDTSNITTISLATLNNNWSCRKDAFSDYRSCFEIRTYRLCHRVLQFHHFEELGPAPYLVGSLECQYSYDDKSGFNFLEFIVSRGYKKTNNIYSFKEIPPIQLQYEEQGWNTEIQEIVGQNQENVPVGLDDELYQWTDLYSEGISGILSEQGTGWYYKRNLGEGEFEKTKPVAPKPSFNGLRDGRLQLQDLEADGRKFVVSYDKSINGYFELTDTDNWLPFRNFLQTPTIDLRDPSVKFLDLNGDGKADILISEDEVFSWYGSKGVAGYDDYQFVRKEQDEEKGPAIVFANPGEFIMLADMSGDGLTDIARIRNGEIVYWPNMGYGRFGAKVIMDNAPWLDSPDLFNAKNIRLADINGSGTTDLIYITQDSFRVWFNQNGNSWHEEEAITPFPVYDNTAHVTVLDLLGHGTSCIVWSSPLPANAGRAMRYIDLMGGKKPFVLKRYENNMGKRVTIEYKTSTAWYLEDSKAGKPWITKLPFPVQCVWRVMTEDLEYVDGALAARLTFTQTYSYHHGYYDYTEREFRGFGRVEQTDTEDYDHFILNAAQNVVEEDLHQPPMKVITWYHTGAWFNRESVLDHFAGEYTKGPFESGVPEPVFPEGLTAAEWQEAARACKGIVLRQEIYALDGSPSEQLPYSAAFHATFIKKLQPKGDQRYAVFLVNESQAITYHYERNLTDPRVTHTFNLTIDDFGHVLRSASIMYGRKQTDATLPLPVQGDQRLLRIVFTENEFTDPIDEPGIYRLPAPCASGSYELTGVTPLNNNYFTHAELLPAFTLAAEIGYEQVATHLSPQKRLIEQTKTYYLQNDLVTPMPFKGMDTMGFIHESYKLALTPSLTNDIYGTKVNDVVLQQAGYVHLADTNWWVASGRNIYRQGGETLNDAAARFYIPVALRDPLGHTIQHTYAYSFLLTGIEDELQNQVVAEVMDYRILQPVLMRDMNDNLSEVATDELGMVIATSIRGTETDGLKGDEPLSNYTIVPLPDIADVVLNPHTYLQGATSFFFYDLFAFKDRQQPCCLVSVVRETHVSESANPGNVQLSVGYYSGLGQSLQTKMQAAPGQALKWENGALIIVDTAPGLRWTGSGRTILNNKGNPVKQYEPWFSTTYNYEPEKELVAIGFPTIYYYDPTGRKIRTVYPNSTFSKTVFDSWKQQVFDENDTVQDISCTWYSDRGSPNPGDPEPADAETRAAWLAAAHAETFSELHSDGSANIIYAIADNGVDGKYATRTIFDAEGNKRQLIDARGNTAIRYKYNMIGKQSYQDSGDAGEDWSLNDAMDQVILSWNDNNQQLSTEYDSLNRPAKHYLVEDYIANTPRKLISFSIYGEGQPNDKVRNLRGKVFQRFSQSGLTENTEYGFKGNGKSVKQQISSEYKLVVEWNTVDPMSLLENELFESFSAVDALNRPSRIVFPDGSISTPAYNEAGLLYNLTVFLSHQNQPVEFIKSIQYNAKGLRERIVYGNNTASRYTYDAKRYRLAQLLTTRNNGADILQDLHYTYDPAGNVTAIRDNAQQTVFFNNAAIEPHCKFYYDALYRLKKAIGREHAGQNQATDQFDKDKTHLPSGSRLTLKGDMNAMQYYEQLYEYDAAGNMLEMVHNAGNGGFVHRWTRSFDYSAANNQLAATTVSGETTNYNYDSQGNMLNLQNGLFNLSWNFANHLKEINLGGGGTAFYVYDSTGQRVRKVIENGNIIKERIYLGGYEFYRERVNGVVSLERETLHIMDDKQRVALVESRMQGNDPGLADLIRYQYDNHLGTVCLEVDGDSNNPEIISYEEFYPFGSSAYQAARNQTETPKRYRYTGKERDEESGLNYHGARYYAPWLCRWTTTDPNGIDDGLNIYLYVSNSPIKMHDPTGHAGKTFGGLTVSPQSKISAQQFVDMIQKSKKLEPWMKDMFAAKGNSIVLTTDKPKLPPGKKWEDVPKWFKSTLTAINSKHWHVTTGASIVSSADKKASSMLIPDKEPGDSIIGGNPDTGAGTTAVTGETVASETLANWTMGTRRVADSAAGGGDTPGARRPAKGNTPAEGLVVVSNRFRDTEGEGQDVSRGNEEILETLFHEVGAHGGEISQGSSGDHGPGNWRTSPTSNSDMMANELASFFGNPSEDDLIFLAKVAGPTGKKWQQAIQDALKELDKIQADLEKTQKGLTETQKKLDKAVR